MPASARNGLRFAGLLATTLMAAGAFLAGALAGSDPAVAVRESGPWQPRHLAGLSVWLAGAVLLAVVWWRLRDCPTGVSWAAVTGVLWALPLVIAPPLGSRDVYAYACQGAVVLDGHDPYAVGAAGGGCPWLSAVPEIWRESPTPYGPLALAMSAAVVAVARTLPVAGSDQLLVAVGLLRTVALAGIALMTWYGVRLARSAGVASDRAIRWGVVTPVVLLHGVSGAHNDALLAGLVVAALAVAAHSPTGRVRTAIGVGVLLGLAVAIKVTALVAVPFAILLVAAQASRNSAQPAHPARNPAQPAHRATDPAQPARPAWGRIAGASAAVGAAGALTYAALSVVTGLGLGWLGALLDTGSLVQWTSLPTGLGMAAGYLLRALGWPQAYDGSVAVARALGLAVLLGVLLYLWLWARRRAATSAGAVVFACGAALAATAVLSPVFYPWYAIAPLAVLAFSTVDERWRHVLAVATVALTFLVLPYGLGIAVLTKLPGALLDVIGVAIAAWWWFNRQRADSGR